MVNKWSDSHLGFPKFGALPPIGFQGILRRFSNDDSVLEALIGGVFFGCTSSIGCDCDGGCVSVCGGNGGGDDDGGGSCDVVVMMVVVLLW